MKLYKQDTYFGFKGEINSIALSDQTYGEWIVYEGGIAKYHVNVFDKDAQSNVTIASLLSDKLETMKTIIRKINTKQRTRLSLSNDPIIKIIKKSETVNLDLGALPEHWMKNIN